MFSVMSPLSHVSSSDSGFMFLSGRIQTQRLKVMAMYVTKKVCSQCPDRRCGGSNWFGPRLSTRAQIQF